jgi:hypothetical protein
MREGEHGATFGIHGDEAEVEAAAAAIEAASVPEADVTTAG